MNETMTTIMNRKSVRAYTDREISPECREQILRAAAAAPTAGNQQLYTILDITSQELKEKLADTCDHQPFIARGKMVLVFCADFQKWYQAFALAGCCPRKPGPGDIFLAVEDALRLHDLKLEDIGEILGENVNTVKARLYRTLKKMRLELEPENSAGR